jgi:hypothetical protein
MRRKSHSQKNTLLKTAQINAATKVFKRVFFSPTLEEFYFFSPTLRCFNFFYQRTVLKSTDIASNISRFGQSVCKLDTSPLQTDRRASGNRVDGLASVS